jgi:DNA-binding transcriptional LysR family regulator
MERALLPHLPVVLAVARRRSFAAAAKELGMTASAVSHAVATVEGRLGVPLFARTTRSVALTEAGQAFVDAAQPALDDVAAAWDAARARRTRASGLLRLNAPRLALPLAVTPVVAAMAARYPDVTVEVWADDALTDIVATGFDAGVRLGQMVAADMVAVRLTPPLAAVIVASPAYLAARGRPQRAADLTGHACVQHRLNSGGNLYRWELQEDGRELAVDTHGPAIVNDPRYAVELALAGVGLVYAFAPLVADHVAAGRLEIVLPDSAIEEPGFFLYFPRRAAEAPKLRAFIDTARSVLRPAAAGA